MHKTQFLNGRGYRRVQIPNNAPGFLGELRDCFGNGFTVFFSVWSKGVPDRAFFVIDNEKTFYGTVSLDPVYCFFDLRLNECENLYGNRALFTILKLAVQA